MIDEFNEIRAHLEGQRAQLEQIEAHMREVVAGQTMVLQVLGLMSGSLTLALKAIAALPPSNVPPS